LISNYLPAKSSSVKGSWQKEKVLICGVARNVAPAVPNTIKNAELLGRHFADYAVIIYENNSKDDTVKLFNDWARKNSRVVFVHENFSSQQSAIARTEKIARARNKVLSIARRPQYRNFKYLVMIDLDFRTDWPVEEILRTIESPIKWDAVSANGCGPNGYYYDRYAFRSKDFPFGPELIGAFFWSNLNESAFILSEGSWVPAYSAFGGLAIYKTKSILKSSYSGRVTKDLKRYYQKILPSIKKDNVHLLAYLKNMKNNEKLKKIPIIFQRNMFSECPRNYPFKVCCEHVPLYATMFLKGHGKFYINPAMKMRLL
jgi:hypothetical protein